MTIRAFALAALLSTCALTACATTPALSRAIGDGEVMAASGLQRHRKLGDAKAGTGGHEQDFDVEGPAIRATGRHRTCDGRRAQRRLDGLIGEPPALLPHLQVHHGRC